MDTGNESKKAELRDRYRQRLQEMNGRRTGVTMRTAKGNLGKREQNDLAREIRKKGVKALTQKLGVGDDPELERMIANMIQSGELSNADQLVQRVTELQQERQSQRAKEAMDQEAKKLMDDAKKHGLPPELDNVGSEAAVIPTLPGANPRVRKALKPLLQNGFQDWLQQGVTPSAPPPPRT